MYRCRILPRSEKGYPFTAGLTESVFQSSDGEAQARFHDIPAIFCTITVLRANELEINYSIAELQWLEQLLNDENMIETGVIRANES